MAQRLGIRLYRPPGASWMGLDTSEGFSAPFSFGGVSFYVSSIGNEDGSAYLVPVGFSEQLRSEAAVWTIWFQPQATPDTGTAAINYAQSALIDGTAPELLSDCNGSIEVVGSMPGSLSAGMFSTIQFTGSASLALPACTGAAPKFWTNFNLTYEIP